jgi:hypothetical protein
MLCKIFFFWNPWASIVGNFTLQRDSLITNFCSGKIVQVNVLANMELWGMGVDMEGCLQAHTVLRKKAKGSREEGLRVSWHDIFTVHSSRQCQCSMQTLEAAHTRRTQEGEKTYWHVGFVKVRDGHLLLSNTQYLLSEVHAKYILQYLYMRNECAIYLYRFFPLSSG